MVLQCCEASNSELDCATLFTTFSSLGGPFGAQFLCAFVLTVVAKSLEYSRPLRPATYIAYDA